METTAIIWANKEMYKDFKCDNCGTKLTKNVNGQEVPIENIMINPEEYYEFEKGKINSYACYCPICHKLVAKIANLNLDKSEVVSKGGNIVDFLKNKANKKKVS